MTIATTRLLTVTGRFYWNDEARQWQPNPDKPPSACEARVCAIINPDRNGFSEWFNIAELCQQLPSCRSLGGTNGSGMFTREMAKDFLFSPDQAKQKDGSRIIARRSYGLTKERDEMFTIRPDIARQVRQRPCAVLGTRSQVEVDHKDGRKNSPTANCLQTQQLDDFQALHKVANNVKREQCKKCVQTNQRFDAQRLGFRVGWTEGAGEYQGTCRGCYWYDPIAFRQQVSK